MKTVSQIGVHVRWMIRRDIPEVLHIEQQSFECAWAEEDFLRCLSRRECFGMVAEQDGKVVGFMIYELHKSKIHILNFAVSPSHRRIGIGGQMVGKLIDRLSNRRLTHITTDVPDDFLPMQLFLRSLGFRAVRVLRRHCDDRRDAYRFRYQLAQECAGK